MKILHDHGYIHRDLKPENFVIGLKENMNNIYLIDYGLSKAYCDINTMEHILFKKSAKLVGTIRYASTNLHLGYEQSRRDDLEALGYILIYFLKGKLPWQGLKTETKEERYKKIGEIKAEITSSKLCDELPNVMVDYIKYCKSLTFEQIPDYNNLRRSFARYFVLADNKNFKFDWLLPMELKDPRRSTSSRGLIKLRDFSAAKKAPFKRIISNRELKFDITKSNHKPKQSMKFLDALLQKQAPSVLNETNISEAYFNEDNNSNCSIHDIIDKNGTCYYKNRRTNSK